MDGERGTYLLRSGGDTGTDGPHGFVGNDDVLPVLLLEDVDAGLDLGLADLHGSTGLSVLQELADAEDDLEAVLEGDLRMATTTTTYLGLLGNELVGLGGDGVASLAVADEGPLETEVYSVRSARQNIPRIMGAESSPVKAP